MTDFICFKCKSKIKTKRWGKSKIEVKCACPHEFDYIRTDDDDDAMEKFLTQFQLVDPEINNIGESWTDSAAKHLEELWFTNPERLAKTELKNYLSKRFGRSVGAITSQLKHMKDSDIQKHESTETSKSPIAKISQLKPKLKNYLSKRFGRSEEYISSQLNNMPISSTENKKVKNDRPQHNEIITTKIIPVVTSIKYPLYHISSIKNLQGILSEGILSHDLSMKNNPEIISDSEIVEMRKRKILFSGNSLTHYANFYFKPENAMLWRILKEAETNHAEDLKNNTDKDSPPENIIIFQINLDLNQPGIFVSDGNCANNITKIEPMPAHDIFSSIDEVLSIRLWYTEPSIPKHKFQAECLIPEKVKVSSIHAIHVQNDTIKEKINEIIEENFPNLKNIIVKKNPPMFFS